MHPFQQEGMTAMDSKPLESLQSASNGEMPKEKEIELLMKELANCKVQLEIKEFAYIQAALQLDSEHKTTEGLLTKQKYSEAERDRSIEQCHEAHSHVTKLESVTKVIADQCPESSENQRQYSHILDELKTLKEELFLMKAELIAAEESKVASLGQVELTKVDVLLEKEKSSKLLMHISELNQTIILSNMAAVKAEKERSAFFSQMESELQIATEAVILHHKQLERMKRQLDMMQHLENELLEKIILTDYLELELKQAKELVASDAINDLSQFRSEIEIMGRAHSEKADYIMFMEAEIKRKEEELQNARKNVNDLECQVEILMSNMQNLKDDISKSSKRELELQVEIADLKSELHKGRSKIAAAEGAEARVMSAQAGLYLAVQQLALEAKAAKNEIERLKLELKDAEAETEVNDDASKVSSGRNFVTSSTEVCSGIKISTEDNETFIQKAEKADTMVTSPLKDEHQLLGCEKKCEVDILKEELKASNAIISDLRFTLEEAIKRAEQAEKAKTAIEDQLRKWRVYQQQRRSASEIIPEQSTRKVMNNMTCEPSATSAKRGSSMSIMDTSKFVPLGKILNLTCEPSATSAKRGSSMSIMNTSKFVPLGKILNMKF